MLEPVGATQALSKAPFINLEMNEMVCIEISSILGQKNMGIFKFCVQYSWT